MTTNGKFDMISTFCSCLVFAVICYFKNANKSVHKATKRKFMDMKFKRGYKHKFVLSIL